jgi:hypothetical protein
LVVSGQHATSRGNRRKQHADSNEPEDRLGEHARQDRQPVGTKAPELGRRKQQVGAHWLRTLKDRARPVGRRLGVSRGDRLDLGR